MNFFIKYKKVFLVAGFILTVIAIAYLMFLAFFKPMISPGPGPEDEPAATSTAPGGFPDSATGPGNIVPDDTEGGLAPEQIPEEESPPVPGTVAQGGLTKTTELNQKNSLTAFPGNNGTDIQYYDESSGKFYQINNNGEVSELSDKVFYNVRNIAWSPSREKAILEYPDGANILYNFEKNEQITLPSHWQDFDFSPDGDNIIMKIMGNNEDSRFLAISSDNGSKIRPLEHLGDKDSNVYSDWSPNDRIVAMYTEGVGLDRQEVFFLGKNNENFKSAVIEGRGFQPKWTPEGDRLMYSVYSNNSGLKPELWVVNADGDNIGTGRKRLNVQTWAEKCTFSSPTEMYCAVPAKLEEGAGMFPEMAKNTTDRLFKIDITTGYKRMVAIPDKDVNMTNLIISDNGYDLYFTDERTRQLHKIKLQ